MRQVLLLLVGVLSVVSVNTGASFSEAPTGQSAQFRTGVDIVSVTAVVRDRRGRLVRDLSPDDFEVFERGERRPILDFRSGDDGALRLALVIDGSGSMRVGSRLAEARSTAAYILDQLRPGEDEVAVYVFDRELTELAPFATDLRAARAALDRVEAYGTTALYDALAEAARRTAPRPLHRRAVVALTDGVDTSSRLTAAEVSGIASSVDVPIYIIAVVSPLDHPGGALAAPGGSTAAGSLVDLARWSGGDVYFASTAAQRAEAARGVVTELRHQYLFAVEAAIQPGWHPLEVRMRPRGLIVRARSGYFAGSTEQFH